MSDLQRCEDDSCSAARYSPPSSNLLREMVKGTEQSCYAQAEVLGTDRPCRGQGVSTSSRRKSKQCENFDNGPIFYIIIIAPSGDSFNNARRVKLPCGTAGSAMVSPGPSTSAGGAEQHPEAPLNCYLQSVFKQTIDFNPVAIPYYKM